MTVRILAIDTATEACSAAILQDDQVISRYAVAPREHTLRLLPMVDELLAEAGLSLSQLDALAFGHGPGSFTGVRIATGLIQGMAFGADRPVVGISTLAAMAQQVASQSRPHVLTAIDARMGEVYWGQYRWSEDGTVVADADERVISPAALAEQVTLPDQPYLAAGTGWQTYGEELGCLAPQITVCEDGMFPHAAAIARLAAKAWRQGKAVEASQALPVYLRNEVTWKKLPGR